MNRQIIETPKYDSQRDRQRERKIDLGKNDRLGKER